MTPAAMEIEMANRRIQISSIDGACNVITVYEPNTKSVGAPVIVVMPAMGVAASFYRPLAQAFNRRGSVVVTADLRGVGESSLRASRTTDFGYFELIHRDWLSVLQAVRAEYAAHPRYVLGHSLGGQISALHLATHESDVSGLILVASGRMHYKAFSRPLKTLVTSHIAWGIAEVIGHMPGKKLGFAGREARQVMRDWTRSIRTGRYLLTEGGKQVDYTDRIKQVRCPVLAVSFADDEFAPRASVQGLCDLFEPSVVEHRSIMPNELGCTTLGHFNWVKHSDRLSNELVPWIAHVTP